ncbi:MAG: SCO family protein [Chloroflexi bacterium]|nr:SCO family protein [Ardenticatenaceae bacterium]MBL1127756.1 SCO family protein [Chloroflexota bacterium]NOG33823.1 SCO family protein [Chloroflexota bacterium]GIK54408.1 MAG: electron transporter SenC [Chloroflexota bacterium]
MTSTTTPAARPSNPFTAPVWLIFYSLLALVALFVGIFIVLRPVVVLPRITLAPGFRLTDQTGAQLSNEDLRGSITLYTFTHTGCQDNCPQTSAVMAQVQARLDELNTGDIPVRLVTISIDPENDTPEQLAAYAAQLGADPAVWQFVTGSPVQIKSVVGGGFSVYYNTREDGIRFDPAFMLVDGAGLWRAEYRTAVPDVDIILRDINLLAEEAQHADGPSRLAYEAAHLFLCYPR